jgi:broad specificity phosphatase PhoE
VPTVILVRHGQTEWNREERFRGRVDLPLNEMGLRQAEAAGRRIASTWSPEAIYASPLSRAMQTAQAIAACLPPDWRPAPQSEAGLIDVDYGEWQGQSPQEVAQRYEPLYQTWLSAPQQIHFPGGESLAVVQERAQATLVEIVDRHHDGAVVLVSHLAVCRVLLLTVLGLDNSYFWHISQENGAINVFKAEKENFYIVTLNDTCHLQSLTR